MPRKRFPRGHIALVSEGYVYLTSGRCRDRECGGAIHWYRTPGGKRLPVDVKKNIPHGWCCLAVERERRERHGIYQAGKPSDQLELFPF